MLGDPALAELQVYAAPHLGRQMTLIDKRTAGAGNDRLGSAIRRVEASGSAMVIRDAVAADVDKRYEKLKQEPVSPGPAPTLEPVSRVRRLRGLVIRRAG